MPSELYRALRVAELAESDIDDFEGIVGAGFIRGEYHARKTIFMLEDGQPALEIQYSKRRRITDVKRHAHLSDVVIRQIRERLEVDLFSRGDFIVSRSTVFSRLPVTGVFRRGDEWQLIPVPSGSPVPNELFAPHPALFEVRHRSAVDEWTRIGRHRRALTRAIGCANGLLKVRIEMERSNARKEWVVGSVPPYMSSELRQIGYFYDSTSLSQGFSNKTGLAGIPFVERDEYYGSIGVGAGQVFSLPSDFEICLDLFSSMNLAEQRQFLHASYWAAHAQFVMGLSRSAAMVAAVSAVEALTLRKEFRTDADGQVVGATRAFNDVMVATLGDNFVKRFDLYALRSDLAHGSHIFIADLYGWNWGLQGREEDAANRFVSFVLPIVLHNWLIPENRRKIAGGSWSGS